MKTWNFVDKSQWSKGPWNTEPDKAHWVYRGLDLLIHRGPSGALCGYVGVPKTHPAFEKGYDEVSSSYDDEGSKKEPMFDIDVHGGLTFSSKCGDEREDGGGICHPKEGAANSEVWWLGFDCAHLGDLCPKYDDYHQSLPGLHGEDSYKNLNYVKAETERLADQLLLL